MPRISIAVPTYEYRGKGSEVLEYAFNTMVKQTFKDFDVVISDHSVDDKIEVLCSNWSDRLDIKYFRNTLERGSASANTLNSMIKSSGEIIKLLCADDYFLDDRALELIYEASDKVDFIATGYFHTRDRVNYFNYHEPSLNPMLHIINTIGTPSCVAIRNHTDMPLPDTNLNYAYDCEFYRSYLDRYPTWRLISEATIANFLWDESISSRISNNVIEKENLYILRKHEYKNS